MRRSATGIGKGMSDRLPSPRLQSIRETISELQKVVWPSREEAVRLSVMVILVSIAIGFLLGLIDAAFGFVIDGLLLGGRGL